MSIKIRYTNKTVSKPSSNLIFFLMKNLILIILKKSYLSRIFLYYDLLKSSDFKKNLLSF